MPFFSVIIPTYNRAHLIEKAVKSLLNQTFNDFEIIIVDDASSDNTEDVVKKINATCISYIKNQTNQERCITRNIGINASKGKYICFLDSDDYHLPHHLESLYKLIISKNEPKAFFFTNAWNETENGERSERVCPDFESTELYTYFLHFTVNPQRWCVHREILTENPFNPDVIICEDMDTSLRIAAKGYPIYQLKERTTVYVAASDSFTYGDSMKWEKELFYLKRIFKQKELIGKLKSSEKNRLLSMCYFHLSQKSHALNNKFLTIFLGIKSFLKYPKGYNGKTNKILLFSIIDCIPLIRFFLNRIRKI